MGLIEIEKVNKKPKNIQPVPYSDTVYINDNINELNNVTPTYTFEQETIKNNNPKVKPKKEKKVKEEIPTFQREGSLLAMCIVTFIKSAFTIFFIVCLSFLIVNILDNKIGLFPHKASYTAEEVNAYLKKTFLVIFGIVSVLSIISMIIINHNVKNRFKDYYLPKYKMFIYDAFVIIENIILYICEMWIIFQVVNSLYKSFKNYLSIGAIIGSVNIETIELLKYMTVIIMTIFIVLNSFSSIDIVHEKNKLVFENEI